MTAPIPALRRPPIASAQQGLALVAEGLQRDIMRELAERGPLPRGRLAARLHTSPTKLHECLQRLRKAEVVAARRRGRAVEYSITESGRGLHQTTTITTHWFRAHPGGPLSPSVGWRALRDIGHSWRMGVVEWIVRCSPTAEEVAQGLAGYESEQLRETLDAMGEAGMVARRKGRDGSEHYRLTAWAARAIGVLAAIAGWEQRYLPPGSAPIEVGDALVALGAALPLVRLDEAAAGICTFAAEVESGQVLQPRLGAVWARVRRGRVVDVGEGAPPGEVVGWARGPFSAWLAAALDGRQAALRRDGRTRAGIALVDGVVVQVHAQLVLYGD